MSSYRMNKLLPNVVLFGFETTEFVKERSEQEEQEQNK